MSIKRRGEYWHYDFSIEGNRFRGSTGFKDKELAAAYEGKLILEIKMETKFGKKASKTLAEVSTRYWQEHAIELRSAKDVWRHIRNLQRALGKNTALDKITNDLISKFKAVRRGEGLSNSTVNRELETLRTMLTMAKKQWDYNVSDIDFSIHMLKEPEARTRYLTEDEAEKLIEVAHPTLKAPIEFALWTGLRAGNIFGLKWEQVNLFNRSMTFKIKSKVLGGKTFTLPITPRIHEILIDQGVKTSGNVFLKESGKPFREYYRKLFTRALDNAEIDNFRFHDLRHTTATWLRFKGVPIEIIMQCLGHTQIATTMKYSHFKNTEVGDAIQKLQIKSQK